VIIVFSSVGQNGGVQKFTTAGAFPGIKRADEVIKFFGKHAAFATWTMHTIPPDNGM
jgi:hypothetical protein